MNTRFEALEWNQIISQLKEYAVSQEAKRQLENLEPEMNEEICRRKMAETTAARTLLDTCGAPPLPSMNQLHELLTAAETGTMLVPEQLMSFAHFADACRRMATYLRRGEACGAQVAAYGRGLLDLSDLQETLEASVNEEQVLNEASPALRDYRRKMDFTETQIKERLAKVVQTHKQELADGYSSRRAGHYVVPVQRGCQSRFPGIVIEVSGTGATVFMEPTAVAKLQEEYRLLEVEADGEVRRILYTLTAMIADEASELRTNMEILEVLDVLFAKAKYSAALHGRAVELHIGRAVRIVQGRHPLLNAEKCIPLNFEISENTNGVIITGPNTGGKTVALKTVGLLSLMAQCGLHIPCDEGSQIAMHDAYWCDIGDSQSISQNLSTFSGHMTNMVSILQQASPDSMVLLDELGSGTDPAEGMGIAIAVLEELRRRGCTFLVTTHYPQVKAYAEQTEGIVCARMAFDRESLRPLYRLEMGKSGESCALYIAQKLGLAPHLLDRAYEEAYGAPNPDAAQCANEYTMPVPKSGLVRSRPVPSGSPEQKFRMGDSVLVLPDRETGIVYRPADDHGEVIVQIKGVKYRIRHTRLRLQVAAAELYPADYDFSIIFDTVENRKARKIMTKRYDPTVSASCEVIIEKK